MEFIDRLGDLLAKPQLDIPSLLSTNNLLVDRHLDSLEDSARDIRRAVETPGGGSHVLMNDVVKIASLEGELLGLKREILSIDDYEEQIERSSRIEQSLFETRVTISSLTEETKQEPIGLPIYI